MSTLSAAAASRMYREDVIKVGEVTVCVLEWSGAGHHSCCCMVPGRTHSGGIESRTRYRSGGYWPWTCLVMA